MKKMFLFIILTCLSRPLLASESIVTLDPRSVLTNSDVYMKLDKKFRKDKKPLINELEALHREGRKISDDQKQDGYLSSEEEMSQGEARLVEIQRKIYKINNDLKNTFADVQSRFTEKHQPIITQILKQLTAEQHYTMIIDSGGIIYSDNNKKVPDISQKVLDEFNRFTRDSE